MAQDRTVVDALPDIAEPADVQRRRWTLLAAGTGGAGLAVTAVPFVASFAPSQRARALGAVVTVSIDGLAEESLTTVEWRGKPVWILRRSAAQLRHLTAPAHHGLLVDPASHRAEQQPADAVNPGPSATSRSPSSRLRATPRNPPRRRQAGPQRPVPVRQWQEVQEVPRRVNAATRVPPQRRALRGPVRRMPAPAPCPRTRGTNRPCSRQLPAP